MSTVGNRAMRFEERLVAMCPESLPVLIDEAARGRVTTRSAYVRDAVLKQLSQDGFQVSADAAAKAVA